ncbi:MAG: arylsulfatase, partial [Clostridiales bacterium]|nr:arylsulfatase [Clostridiales bacterium]
MHSKKKIKSYPNIVFVMADDMGYGDPGCYGAEKIKTPAIDRLASEGMLFTDAHSSSAVCSPSRYSVLTGRYAWRSRLKNGVQCGHGAPLIEEGRSTIATLLKSKGYSTGAFGKWHLGFDYRLKNGDLIPVEKSYLDKNDADNMLFDYSKPLKGGPLNCGFDLFFGISGSLDMPPYCFIENENTVGIPNIPKKTVTQQRPGLTVQGWDDTIVDVKFTEKTCSFIKKESENNTPFFAYVPLSSPHRPNVSPEFVSGKSDAGPRGDSVMLADWCLGKILETIDECNVTDNTIVIFTSDNGANPCDFYGRSYGHKSCGDLRGYKADIYEGGHRVPFIVKWPEVVKSNSVSNSLTGLIDLFATIEEITDSIKSNSDDRDSFSFLPILKDPSAETRETIINHSAKGMFAIRSKYWKMIDGLGSGGQSLPYSHLPQHPGETGQLYS